MSFLVAGFWGCIMALNPAGYVFLAAYIMPGKHYGTDDTAAGDDNVMITATEGLSETPRRLVAASRTGAG